MTRLHICARLEKLQFCCKKRRRQNVIWNIQSDDIGMCPNLRENRWKRRSMLAIPFAWRLHSEIARAREVDSPYQKSLDGYSDFGVDENGLLKSCRGVANCVSTTSRTPDQYAAAWRGPRDLSPTDVADQLVKEIKNLDGSNLLEYKVLEDKNEREIENDVSRRVYMRFLVPGVYGKDMLEFLVIDKQIQDRNWSGDTDGCLINFTSRGYTKYLYPITQPLGDFGRQKLRLLQIREGLGWKMIGCELIECYQ